MIFIYEEIVVHMNAPFIGFKFLRSSVEIEVPRYKIYNFFVQVVLHILAVRHLQTGSTANNICIFLFMFYYVIFR